MKDKFNNIEDLFKDGLDGYESDVDPGVWDNISAQISGGSASPDASASSSSSSATSVVSSSVVKMAIVAGAAGVLSVGAYLYMGDGEEQLNEDAAISKIEQVVPEKNKIEEVEPIIEVQKNIVKDDVIKSEPASEKDNNVEVMSVATPEEDFNVSSSTKPEMAESTPQNAQEIEREEETIQIKPNNAPIVKSESVVIPEESILEEEDVIITEPSIYASIKSGVFPLTVEFENRGTQSEDIFWKLGDGEELEGEPYVEHTFETSGDYWVVLRIKDEKGNFYKDSTLISVFGKTVLDIPNIFTPNGDGINDEFIIGSEYIQTMNCSILDRSGKLIFRWNGLERNWNGRDMRGNPVAPGTYMVTVETIDLDGRKDAQMRTLTIAK